LQLPFFMHDTLQLFWSDWAEFSTKRMDWLCSIFSKLSIEQIDI